MQSWYQHSTPPAPQEAQKEEDKQPLQPLHQPTVEDDTESTAENKSEQQHGSTMPDSRSTLSYSLFNATPVHHTIFWKLSCTPQHCAFRLPACLLPYILFRRFPHLFFCSPYSATFGAWKAWMQQARKAHCRWSGIQPYQSSFDPANTSDNAPFASFSMDSMWNVE